MWGKKLFPPGVQGHSPWCSFPYFFKEIGPRREGKVSARSNGDSQTEKPTQQAAGHPLTRET